MVQVQQLKLTPITKLSLPVFEMQPMVQSYSQEQMSLPLVVSLKLQIQLIF
jgi:hypothetical protein